MLKKTFLAAKKTFLDARKKILWLLKNTFLAANFNLKATQMFSNAIFEHYCCYDDKTQCFARGKKEKWF